MKPDCIGRGFGPVGTNGPTDTFDAVLAKAFKHSEADAGLFDWEVAEHLGRLSAAHAAEVAERDARIAELEYRLQTANAYGLQCDDDIRALLARAEAAERDARELRADIAKVYAMVPSLPVAPETCEAATDALHYIGLMMGFHDIDPAIATAEQAAGGIVRDGGE